MDYWPINAESSLLRYENIKCYTSSSVVCAHNFARNNPFIQHKSLDRNPVLECEVMLYCKLTLEICWLSHSLPSGASAKQVIALREFTLTSDDRSSSNIFINGSIAPLFIAVYFPLVVIVILCKSKHNRRYTTHHKKVIKLQ